MRKLFEHPLAKPIIHGALQVAVLAMWVNGSLQRLLARYCDWVLPELQRLPWYRALPLAASFGVAGALAVLATIELPVDVLRIAEHFVRRFNARRSGT